MAPRLAVTIGQHSSQGRKPGNQDFYGALIPTEPALSLKGIAVALADGISSSDVSGEASSAVVRSFLTDYYCTSDSWSVKTSAQRVIAAINSWLYAKTRRGPHRYDPDRGYVCTLSLLILKAGLAHIFHIGDSRIHRVSGRTLEQITADHRVMEGAGRSYLGRALGITAHAELDYHTLPIEPGDVFVLTTDGVHDHLPPERIAAQIAATPDDLDHAARLLVDEAFAAGSPDNLTIQIVRIDAVPLGDATDLLEQPDLPPAPPLEPGGSLDGYRVLRTLHRSHRSHLHLVADAGGALAVLKAPSIDLGADAAALKRFRMEEWIARRITSPHVVRAHPPTGRRTHLYLVLDYIEGQTLAQWMRDHPSPSLEAVRGIVEQVARGLLAFHRRDMVHQDLRPENVMIDAAGTVTIIDLGSTKVAGVTEMRPGDPAQERLGTAQFTAPECLLGEDATEGSDLYSLGVIAYQMLTGALPYGADAPRLQTRAQLRRLHYRPARDRRPDLPPWVDAALRRAVHPAPGKRYAVGSEFMQDLRVPNPDLVARRTPWVERDPVLFWKALSLLLGTAVLGLLAIR